MCREAAAPDGVRRVLDILARRVDGAAVLAGDQVLAVPSTAASLLDTLADDVTRVRSGRSGAAALQVDGQDVAVLPVDALVLVVAGRFTPETHALLADAVDPLRLAWRAAAAEQRAASLAAADATTREAVLHLLMVGHLSGARRTAAALGPELPDLARVYLIESEPEIRGKLTELCREVFEGAWVVPCPVYSRHVIVLAPAESDAPDRVEDLTAAFPDNRLGVGLRVPLRDIPVGYKQAFHALSVARQRPERYARFSPRGQLGELLGDAGRAWAARTLAPLLAYHPSRPQDPDAYELLATLLSWMDFGNQAAAQLKIHRNTLASRLAHISAKLGRDLSRLDEQSELYLALQLIDERPAADDTDAPDLASLLDDPAVRGWAEIQLAPLLPADRATLLATVHTWLAHDLQPVPVAAALGISAHGLRKRLARAEDLLDRALLTGPSSKYDLHLAFRANPALVPV